MRVTAQDRCKFSVGQRIWEYDENRRVYRQDPGTRHPTGKLIYAECFRARWIVGIEKMGYLVAYGESFSDASESWTEKIAFAKAEKILLTTAEKEDRIYRHDHGCRLAEIVRDADATTLRRVAEVVGYREEDVP